MLTRAIFYAKSRETDARRLETVPEHEIGDVGAAKMCYYVRVSSSRPHVVRWSRQPAVS